MSSLKQSALCLALTIFGPLTFVPTEGSESDVCMEKEKASPRTRAGNRALKFLGQSAYSVFSSVQWGTIKALLGVVGSVDNWLEWLQSTCPVAEDEVPYLSAGIEMLHRLDAEHSMLVDDVGRLQNELHANRDRCVALSRENTVLRQRLATSRESGVILEQDRQQLQALLDDKGRLQEENYRLEREIGALQELLEYAAEHVVEEGRLVGLDEDDMDEILDPMDD